MKLVFDLDGVLRELNSYLEDRFNIPYPQKWFWKHKDKDIFDWIKGDKYHALIYAPTTEYLLPILKATEHIELWTCQPEKWKSYTKLWIDVNIGNAVIHYLDTKQKRERLDKEKDTYLVEDNPNFSSYERILLIDKPYNRCVEVEHRIKHPKDLSHWLKENEYAKKD